MQRTYKRLSVAVVNKLVAACVPGMYPDGDGLYLSISKAGSASWSFKYMIAGRGREMGLGPQRHVSLSAARQACYEARALKRQGVDPLEARRDQKLGAAVARAKSMTFAQCAKQYIVAHQKSWSAQHTHQWTSLETHVYPVIGALPVETSPKNLALRASAGTS